MLSLVRSFAKYADFTGRAARGEFWIFFVFWAVAVTIANLIDRSDGTFETVFYRFGFYEFIAFLVLLLPFLSVSARRLHDTGRSGWWMLTMYVPYVCWVVAADGTDIEKLCLGGIAVGFITLVVLWVLPGDAGVNEYGGPVGNGHAIAG